MKKIKLSLRHEFTQKELDSRRDELAKVTIDAGELKERAKAEAAARKEDLDILDGRRKHLSRQIIAKGEDRETECLVRFNVPRPGLKRTIRLDTGEMVTEGERMSFDERQSHLFVYQDAELFLLEKLYGGDGPIEEIPQAPAEAPAEAPQDGKTAAAGPDPQVAEGPVQEIRIDPVGAIQEIRIAEEPGEQPEQQEQQEQREQPTPIDGGERPADELVQYFCDHCSPGEPCLDCENRNRAERSHHGLAS